MKSRRQKGSRGEEARIAVSEKDLLLGISQAASRISDLQRLLRTSIRIAGQGMGVDRCSVWLAHDNQKCAKLEAVWVKGRFRSAHLGARMDLKNFPKFKRIISEGKAIHSPDIAKVVANRYEKRLFAQAGIKSSLSVPLKIKNRVLGALNFGTLRSHRTFTPAEIRLGKIIANQMAVGIENAVLCKKLEDRAAGLREQSIKALRDSEETYRTLLENLPQLIFLKDKRSVYVSVNKNFCRSMGIKPEQIIGKTDFDFFPRDLAQKYRRDDREIIRTGKTKEIVEDYIEKGRRRIVQTVKTPVLGNDGKPIGVLGIFWDITERKEAEQIQSVLYKIADSVHRVRDLRELFQTIHKVLSTVMDTTNFFIALYDKATDTVSLPYCVDQKDTFKTFPARKTLTAYVIKHGKPLLVTREVRKRLIESGKVETMGARSKIWLGVPLKIGEEVIGAVTVQSYTNPSAYGQRELEILKFASHQIASAIQRKKAENTLIRDEQIARERARLLTDLRSLDDMDDILTRVCRAVSDSGLFRRAVMTLNKPGGEIINLGQVGLSAQAIQRAKKAPPLDPKLRARITNKRFRVSDSFFVPVEAGVDFSKSRRHIPEKGKKDVYGDWQAGDELFVPLRDFSGKIMGYLSADTPVDGSRPDKKTIEALEMLVEAAASRIREVEAQKSVKKQRDFSQSIMETANSMIVCLDHDTRVTAFNKECERITGYHRQEVLGKKWPEMFLPPEYRHKKLKSFASWVRAHPRDQYEGPIKTKKGEVRTILWSNTAILGPREKDITAIAIGQDITERKKTEEALQLSQERYKLSTKAAKVGVWDWDLKSNRFYIDPNIKEILGYKDKEIPNDIEVWTTYVHPDDLKPVMTAAQACIDGRTPKYVFEHRMMHKDGSVRWILSNGKVIRDKDGNAVRMIGTDTDVTERKMAEEAFRESEHRFRMMAEASPDYIFQTDKSGKTIYCSPAIKRILGYTPEERQGTEFSTIISPSELLRAKTLFSKAIGGETIQNLEINLIHKSGRTVPIEVSVVPIFENGEVSSLFGIARDITKRKRMEEEVKKSEEKYRRLVETSNDMIFTVDLKGNFLFTNKALEKHLGYSDKEIRKINGFELVHPQDLKIVKEQFAQLVEGKSVDNMEYRYKAKPGHYVHILNNASPIFDSQGNVVATLGIARDITEHKRADEALKESEEKFRNLFENANDAIFLANPKTGIIVDSNKHAERLLNRPREEIIGLHQSKLHPPDKEKYYKEMFRRHGEKGGSVNFEAEVIGKDGAVVPVYINAGVIKIAGKKVIQGIFRDITELKKADEALKESQKFLDEIIDHIPDPVFIKNRKHQWILLNKAIGEMLGYPREKMLGRTDYDFFPKKQADFFWKKDQEMFKTGKIVDIPEEPITDAKGNVHWLHTKKAPLRDSSGKITTLVGIIRDITDQKKAVEALRKSKDLTTILEISYKTSQIHDLDKMLQLTCEETAKALGIDRCSISLVDEEEKEGEVRAVYVKNQPHPQILGRKFSVTDFRQILKIYRGKEKFFHAPVVDKAKISRKEKDYFKAEGVKSFVTVAIDAGKKLLGIFVVSSMEKEKVFAESEIAFVQTLASHLAVAVQNIKLMDLVKEQAENLRTLAQRVVSAQEEERKRIAQELHDEIGQILTVMKLNMEMSRREIPSEYTRVIDRIKDSEDLVRETLNEVRNLTANLRPTELDDFGLIPTLNSYVENFYRRTNIQVVLKAENYRGMIPADVEMVLYRITQEALTNVAKHAKAAHVSIILEKKNNYALLTVKDDGIGFDAEGVMKQQKARKGFGLFNIKERVKLLNGSFSITSKPKKGTRLQVRIPCPKGR